jgi:hypothetical protein
MTTIDFITALFCQVDDCLSGLPKHPDARLCPSDAALNHTDIGSIPLERRASIP